MKLRNKKTGGICELGHIRQAWREEKDGGMGYMFLKANDNNGIIYNSLAEMMDEWEDYTPAEPLIKDEKVRKAVRAWAEANGYSLVKIGYDMASEPNEGLLQIHFEDAGIVDDDKFGVHSIAELCGEEEE